MPASAMATAGRPLTEVAFPLEKLPHLELSLRTRRATFHTDALKAVRQIHPPEIMAFMEAADLSKSRNGAPALLSEVMTNGK